MKITYTITMTSALLLAAGCAHEERSYTTSETGYSSGHISEYNSQNNYSSPSARGSYSSGRASSSQPTYSGSVGADGTYTPYANSDTSAISGGYAAGAGTEPRNPNVAQVRETLRQDPEIALIVPNIQISAHNGVIILNGSVQSEEQKRQILSKIKNVTGVVTVNNQLNVMAGPNGQNSSGSQLNPTGASSDDSQRLYKDANGQDSSTNNALNSTSRQNGQTQIYKESDQGRSGTDANSQGLTGQNQSPNNIQSNDALNPTSRSSGQSQEFQNGQQQNSGGQSDTNSLNQTSRPNSSSQIYHDSNQGNTGQDQNQSNMNQSSNSVNDSSNSLSPTSRQNGSSQIYQNNPGENSQQNQNSNSVQGTTIQNQ